MCLLNIYQGNAHLRPDGKAHLPWIGLFQGICSSKDVHKTKRCMSPSITQVQVLQESKKHRTNPSIGQVHFWAGIVEFDTFGSLGDHTTSRL